VKRRASGAVTPRLAGVLVAALAVLAITGCGGDRRGTSATTGAGALPRALVEESRPVGRGPLFQPPARGQVVGACRRPLGVRAGVHVELFAANRVVIVPAGLGTLPPRTTLSGRITSARCYGDVVTLEPTGLVLVRQGAHTALSELFRDWGQPLTPVRLGPFSASPSKPVLVFVDGRRWRRSPGAVPLARHAVIVLEVGPYVRPHVSYRFPPGT
jgi:hypothetical protein